MFFVMIIIRFIDFIALSKDRVQLTLPLPRRICPGLSANEIQIHSVLIGKKSPNTNEFQEFVYYYTL